MRSLENENLVKTEEQHHLKNNLFIQHLEELFRYDLKSHLVNRNHERHFIRFLVNHMSHTSNYI